MPLVAAALAAGSDHRRSRRVVGRRQHLPRVASTSYGTKAGSSSSVSSWRGGRPTKRSATGPIGSTPSPATTTGRRRAGGIVKPVHIAASTTRCTSKRSSIRSAGRRSPRHGTASTTNSASPTRHNPDAAPRTPAQRRLDALVEMAVRRHHQWRQHGGGRPRPLVTVAVGDHSFRRLCELSDGTVVKPGELVPYVGDLDVNAILFNGPPTRSAVRRRARSAGCCAERSKFVTESANTLPATVTRSTAATSTTSSPEPPAAPPANTTDD